MKSDLLLEAGAPLHEARNSLHESLAIASEHGAKSLELRASTSLGRLEHWADSP